MNGRGGRREGAGRKPGVPNKVNGEIREIARQFGPAAIARLAEFAGLTEGERAETHAAQIAAIKELLDRGYGRATQPVAGDAVAGPIVYEFRWADDPAPATAPLIADESAMVEGEAVDDDTVTVIRADEAAD